MRFTQNQGIRLQRTAIALAVAALTLPALAQ